jgi:MFS family permease
MMVRTIGSPSNEQTPLLQPQQTTAPQQQQEDGRERQQAKAVPLKRRSERFVVLVLILAILTIGTGDELQKPATTRLFESIYCRAYWAKHDPSLIGSDGGDGVAEEYCKNHEIQGDVAMLRGWQLTIEAFVMLLVSVPWGYAADVYGRKPVLVLLMFGLFIRATWIQIVCYFWRTIPIKAVWATAATGLLGGGAAITVAIMFTIITDVVPQEARASRFFQIAGSAMVTQVVGPFGSAALMKYDPWIPMLLGLFLQVVVIFEIFLLPETKDYVAKEESTESEETRPDGDSTCSEKASPWQNLRDAVQDSITFLAADRRLLLLIPAFFMQMLIGTNEVFLQYVSTRYSLSLANATLVVTIKSALTLGLLLVFFPAVNHVLRTNFKWHPQRVDLHLSRFCAIALGVGFLLMAAASSIPVLITAMAVGALGSGLHLSLRSLATSFVEPHHVARLMTFVSWIDVGGFMVASPLIAWLFERGVDRGGIWMGLPWLFCAAVFGVVTVLIGMISLGDNQLKDADQEPLVSPDVPGAVQEA